MTSKRLFTVRGSVVTTSATRSPALTSCSGNTQRLVRRPASGLFTAAWMTSTWPTKLFGLRFLNQNATAAANTKRKKTVGKPLCLNRRQYGTGGLGMGASGSTVLPYHRSGHLDNRLESRLRLPTIRASARRSQSCLDGVAGRRADRMPDGLTASHAAGHGHRAR